MYAEDYDPALIIGNMCHIPIFMIHPCFLKEDGIEYEQQKDIVPMEGVADMRILSPQMHPLHRQRIHVGMRGYFVEGSRRVAEAEVIDILYLNHDVPRE